MARMEINATEYEQLLGAMENYAGDVTRVINGVLHGEGYDLSESEIRKLIPVSNRNWKGKKAGAKAAKNSLRKIAEPLAVTVATSTNYSYLYFPDDGSNTRHHAGNQQFFWYGGENAIDDIVERCIEKLTDDF